MSTVFVTLAILLLSFGVIISGQHPNTTQPPAAQQPAQPKQQSLCDETLTFTLDHILNVIIFQVNVPICVARRINKFIKENPESISYIKAFTIVYKKIKPEIDIALSSGKDLNYEIYETNKINRLIVKILRDPNTWGYPAEVKSERIKYGWLADTVKTFIHIPLSKILN